MVPSFGFDKGSSEVFESKTGQLDDDQLTESNAHLSA